jgi:hypothetical protein
MRDVIKNQALPWLALALLAAQSPDALGQGGSGSSGAKSVPPPLQQDGPTAVSFRHDVIAAFNVAGCNAGACHGTPSGKNGFKLSLRGFDPAADYNQLTRDVTGRRTNRQEPEASLILLKGLGKVPHEGGVRLLPDSYQTAVIRSWLRAGLPDDPPSLPGVAKIEVLPGPRTVVAPAKSQQLKVIAHFTDGSSRDVTRLTVFSTSDEHVAKVDVSGKVELFQTGEVAILARYLETLLATRFTYLVPRPDFAWPNPPTNNYIDKHVFARLKQLQIEPSALSGDDEFLRRVYLDALGVLPTPDEARAFHKDTRPDKRARLIDDLLKRPEHADIWALRWADVLNANRRLLQAKGAYALHHWLHDNLERNTPLDVLARELLTATGSTFENPAANFFRSDRKARDPQGLAQATAQLFLGARISCAQCHNHPFEKWTQDDYYGLAAFFARVQHSADPLYPRINRFNQGALVISLNQSGEVLHPRTGKAQPPRLPGAGAVDIPRSTDRRKVLADWLTRADNPFFARAAVNRVWYHLHGRGIVDPVDDFRDSNPPAIPELLDALAGDFAAHGYDLKYLVWTILTSRVYQLSSRPSAGNVADDRFFSHAVTRLLPAEPLLDALSTATEVPEEWAGEAKGTRAVQLPDPDVFQHPFLNAFGQPARETVCECERQGDASLGQALQLINGPTLKSKLTASDNRIGRLLKSSTTPEAIVEELYLATLSRLPTAAERSTTLAYVNRSAARRAAWEDVQWALINSKEFLFRH